MQISSSPTRFQSDQQLTLQTETNRMNGTLSCSPQQARKSVSPDQASNSICNHVPKNSKRHGQRNSQRWKKKMSNTCAVSTPCQRTTAPSTKCMSHQLMKPKCALMPEDSLLVTMNVLQMFIFQTITKVGFLTTPINHVMP